MLVAIDKFSSLQSGWINDGAIRLSILAVKPSCPVALLTEMLLMISATCCCLISGMKKLVVVLNLDEINFFSFESSKTESLDRSFFPSCSRILGKRRLIHRLLMTHHILSHFPSPIPRFWSLCLKDFPYFQINVSANPSQSS